MKRVKTLDEMRRSRFSLVQSVEFPQGLGMDPLPESRQHMTLPSDPALELQAAIGVLVAARLRLAEPEGVGLTCRYWSQVQSRLDRGQATCYELATTVADCFRQEARQQYGVLSDPGHLVHVASFSIEVAA